MLWGAQEGLGPGLYYCSDYKVSRFGVRRGQQGGEGVPSSR